MMVTGQNDEHRDDRRLRGGSWWSAICLPCSHACHACDRRTDRQTDRITIPKTALPYHLFCPSNCSCCCTVSSYGKHGTLCLLTLDPVILGRLSNAVSKPTCLHSLNCAYMTTPWRYTNVILLLYKIRTFRTKFIRYNHKTIVVSKSRKTRLQNDPWRVLRSIGLRQQRKSKKHDMYSVIKSK